MKIIRRGLTMVELVAVMIIIGILAAIISPHMMRSRMRGKIMSMQNTLDTILLAAKQYEILTQGPLPPAGWHTVTDINNNLHIHIVEDPDWGLDVDAPSGGGPQVEASYQGSGGYSMTLHVEGEAGNSTCQGADCGKFGF